MWKKKTVTGIPNHLNYFVIFYGVYTIYKCGRGLRVAGCRPMIWAMPYCCWKVGKLNMNMGH